MDTKNYSEVLRCILWKGGGGTGHAAKWAKDGGKLKVAVYGERIIADSGNGLKRGKGSIQGPAFSSYAAYIISPHIADGGTGCAFPEQISQIS